MNKPRRFRSINDSQAVAELLGGAVGVLPTDTVYGLAAAAANHAAVARRCAI